MTTLSLVSYRPEHGLILVDRDTGNVDSWSSAFEKEKRGPAWTAMEDNFPIACAGVAIPWPGVGMAWVTLGKGAETHKIWLTRTIKRILADIMLFSKLHRVEA